MVMGDQTIKLTNNILNINSAVLNAATLAYPEVDEIYSFSELIDLIKVDLNRWYNNQAGDITAGQRNLVINLINTAYTNTSNDARVLLVNTIKDSPQIFKSSPEYKQLTFIPPVNISAPVTPPVATTPPANEKPPVPSLPNAGETNTVAGTPNTNLPTRESSIEEPARWGMKVVGSETFYFNLLPAMDSVIPLQGSKEVPNAMPGIATTIKSAIRKLSVPGSKPIYQHLGIDSILITIVGMFSGNDGTDPSVVGISDLAMRSDFIVDTYSPFLRFQSLTNRQKLSVEINMARYGGVNMVFTGYLKTIETYLSRSNRNYYTIQFEVDKLISEEECTAVKIDYIPESIKEDIKAANSKEVQVANAVIQTKECLRSNNINPSGNWVVQQSNIENLPNRASGDAAVTEYKVDRQIKCSNITVNPGTLLIVEYVNSKGVRTGYMPKASDVELITDLYRNNPRIEFSRDGGQDATTILSIAATGLSIIGGAAAVIQGIAAVTAATTAGATVAAGGGIALGVVGVGAGAVELFGAGQDLLSGREITWGDRTSQAISGVLGAASGGFALIRKAGWFGKAAAPVTPQAVAPVASQPVIASSVIREKTIKILQAVGSTPSIVVDKVKQLYKPPYTNENVIAVLQDLKLPYDSDVVQYIRYLISL